MTITINNTDYELNFGIRFVRELDEKHFVSLPNGGKFGVGLAEMVPQLIAMDVIALEEVIYCATCTLKKRPTMGQMDDFIDGAQDIDALFKEVLDELKKWNATKKQTLDAVAATKTRA